MKIEALNDALGAEPVHRGKVRDIYAIDEDKLLMVASDRLSAFDVVLPDPIPDKGRVLTRVSNFWFLKTQHIIANHLLTDDLSCLKLSGDAGGYLQGRSVLVRKLRPLPVEAIVRGYLIGSGWKDYLATGGVCGIQLPKDLRQASQLQTPLFTPSTKAAVGDHDENIPFAQVKVLIGDELANKLRQVSLEIYAYVAKYARERGIIIADTKFEFGLDENDQLILMDEVLTPDSSRFWPADKYREGISPPSYDKQFVRDYLETLDWDKRAPGPRLPLEVIRNTTRIYQHAAERLIQDTV